MLSAVISNNRYAKMYQHLTLSFCHKINTAPLRPRAGLAGGHYWHRLEYQNIVLIISTE